MRLGYVCMCVCLEHDMIFVANTAQWLCNEYIHSLIGVQLLERWLCHFVHCLTSDGFILSWKIVWRFDISSPVTLGWCVVNSNGKNTSKLTCAFLWSIISWNLGPEFDYYSSCFAGHWKWIKSHMSSLSERIQVVNKESWYLDYCVLPLCPLVSTLHNCLLHLHLSSFASQEDYLGKFHIKRKGVKNTTANKNWEKR